MEILEIPSNRKHVSYQKSKIQILPNRRKGQKWVPLQCLKYTHYFEFQFRVLKKCTKKCFLLDDFSQILSYQTEFAVIFDLKILVKNGTRYTVLYNFELWLIVFQLVPFITVYQTSFQIHPVSVSNLITYNRIAKLLVNWRNFKQFFKFYRFSRICPRVSSASPKNVQYFPSNRKLLFFRKLPIRRNPEIQKLPIRNQGKGTNRSNRPVTPQPVTNK